MCMAYAGIRKIVRERTPAAVLILKAIAIINIIKGIRKVQPKMHK